MLTKKKYAKYRQPRHCLTKTVNREQDPVERFEVWWWEEGIRTRMWERGKEKEIENYGYYKKIGERERESVPGK